MIEFRNVRKVFPDPSGRGEVVALKDLSFEVPQGKTVCLIGTSGCGKTTAMKLINGLIKPTSGEVLVNNEPVSNQNLIRLRRDIGYVIQKGGLFPHMTVTRNIGILCELERWPKSKIRERVDELMGMVNLPPDEFANRYPNDLSGGQRQRVGVARSLALDPKYILMDEPFGALDPITRRQIHSEFINLQNNLKKTIVLVTHDMDEAFRLADQVAVMDRGEIQQFATPEEIRESPANEFVANFIRQQPHDDS